MPLPLLAMPRGKILLCLLLLLLLPLAVPSPAAAQSSSPGREQTLVIGMVSENPKKHYPTLMPIAAYAARHLEDLGIRRARVLIATSHQQMLDYLRQGKVDWVSEGPFAAVLLRDGAGAEILLRRRSGGLEEQHTVFFTRRDSAIGSLGDLRGKVLALKDPGSSVAGLCPLLLLREQGLALHRLDKPRQKAPPGKVGYIFAGEEINMATWVHKGLADAAAFSNYDWDSQAHTPISFRKDFRIFFRSPPFSSALELVRGDLDPRVKERLREILLFAHTDLEGRAALLAYGETRRFDRLDGGSRQQLDSIRRRIGILPREVLP